MVRDVENVSPAAFRRVPQSDKVWRSHPKLKASQEEYSWNWKLCEPPATRGNFPATVLFVITKE